MMGDPAQSRNRGAMVLAASVVAMLATRAIPDAGGWFALKMVMLIGGMTGAMFGGVWTILCWIDSKRYKRLMVGEGVIARWTVDPARWEWFRHHSKEWDKVDGWPPNLAELDQAPDPGGIEVVVTSDCILIGRHFCSFEKNVTVRAHPDWMHFHFTIWKKSGPPFPVNLRVPLARDGKQDAERMVKAFHEAGQVRVSGVKMMTLMFLGIIGGIAALTALAMGIARLLGFDP